MMKNVLCAKKINEDLEHIFVKCEYTKSKKNLINLVLLRFKRNMSEED